MQNEYSNSNTNASVYQLHKIHCLKEIPTYCIHL